ncbi:hypothetical protein [Alicyclobacillus fodiniaquatilis]|uniref:Uncharacterized protein n=1 Tax=Alicyclobacillus fodiniaquatilis TaxID=1661150 RepID=A0ABW4JQZ6_9BACL
MPSYQHASYTGDKVILENNLLRVEVHKRITGWGWVEFYTPSGEFMGVLDHLGEIMLRDQDVPMRLEADDVEQMTGDFGQRLVFTVKSVIVQEKLQGTSFENWIHYPVKEHCLEGEVSLTLLSNAPRLQVEFNLTSMANLNARYVRGPWLKAGVDAFGADKEDAIFPGVEWLLDDEWSSGTDWFKDPWAKRFVPHPNKVAIPLMAISHHGQVLGISWNPNQLATQWFNYRKHYAQPVFASPNFIDRQSSHLMGLMVPDVVEESEENKVYADVPLELHPGQKIRFEAEVFLHRGTSLDAVVEWVKRKGMPEPPCPRWPLEEALHRIADAYNSRFWKDDIGFGNHQHPDSFGPYEPRFLELYLSRYRDTALGRELQNKLDWCRRQPNFRSPSKLRGQRIERMNQAEQLKYGEELLAWQSEDGTFPFDPDGRHYSKDDFVVARAFIEPMGLSGDTALAISMLPAMELMMLGETTGEHKFLDGAKKALDVCQKMRRPEGGDFWETPLHSPNLLAAGHAAIAYYTGYKVFGVKVYRQQAIRWLRSLLPFTHLWQPKQIPLMYNTKPCFCSSDWYFANWVRDHVQWEILETFATSIGLGIDWGEVDPEIDWRRYQKGITIAGLRFMIDHQLENWQPHNMPETDELYRQGLLDDTFADTHNSITGNYGGMAIMPDPIAMNLLKVLES